MYVIGFRGPETNWSSYKTVMEKSVASFKLKEKSIKQKLTFSNGKTLADGVRSDKFLLHSIEGSDGKRKLEQTNYFFAFSGRQQVAGQLAHSGYDEPSAIFVLDTPLFAPYSADDKGYREFMIDAATVRRLEETVGYDVSTQIAIEGGNIFTCPCSPPFMGRSLLLSPTR